MKVRASDSFAIDLAARAIGRGEVICLPTDTVYGIGADPFDRDAISRLLTAKSRTRANPPPVLVSDIAQAQSVAATISNLGLALMEEFWPGALTIVVPAREDIGWDLGQTNGTVALRVPDSQLTRDLLSVVGPLAVTSANQHGEPPATTVDEAVAQLGDAVTLYLDGGLVGGGAGIASTIVDVREPMRILRHGGISQEQLETVLGVEL
ncbi:tRNA threonylcarbamoyl adenosine modification protein (Sua5/YciO/YrdC/YwlC family) [Trueperella bonasi]|uniref:L-threonylcarbamoyladenylate synthase n=1 Tax=Trueperella bonasi TaxID=312286 RepID=A0ABT9NH66_9ACTO|nr:L-threonylcarbamoyladenylate synthase [Trueperella bonasi]MDP9806747.1 tRNA threonylcarbamoyl adenosine modification protein (Sua5/YciO/YrdC/YwlC family) [Trueperella bonasi]